jgi:hypothetical protein
VRHAIPVLFEILYVSAVTLLLRVESDSPDGLEETSEPARSWWVEYGEDDGRIGCPSAVLQPLVWLLVHHNDDGTWGKGPVEFEGQLIGQPGLTALPLLPLMGAGYSPLSKDIFVYEGGDWCFGRELSRGIDWLLRDQREDGTFRSAGAGPFDRILPAFALAEAYGRTARETYRKPAQAAVDAMLRLQKQNGSWEGAGPTAWAIITLYSAKEAELSFDPVALESALRCAKPPGHSGAGLSRILLKERADEAAQSLQEESIGRDTKNLAWWYVATLGAYAHGGGWVGNGGPPWSAWNPRIKEKLVPLLRRDGSVDGSSYGDTVVRTSLLQLTLEVYYRYKYAFTPR